MRRDLSFRILCVSRDRLLGATRQLVLQTRFATTSIYDVREMAMLEGGFDLLVLCHSLSAEECALASLIARNLWAGAQVLALSVHGHMCGEGSFDQALIGMPEPAMLIQKVGSMLRGREGDSYATWVFRSIEEWDYFPSMDEDRKGQIAPGKVLVH